MSLISVKNAALAFDERVIWRDLSFEIEAGEFVAVIGANGSGKSMLLKSILGQQKLSSGSITFMGKPGGHGNTQIGYVPQHRAVCGIALPSPFIPPRRRRLLSAWQVFS